MRPVPLAVDLVLVQTGAPWPSVDRPGVPSAEGLHGLNTTLAVRLGSGQGWAFEWESHTARGVWRVPAVLESVAVRSHPVAGDGMEARVEALAMLRTVMVPEPGERGDVGRRIADRLEGAVWRYRVGGAEAAALVTVGGVRVDDPLREPVQLYERCDVSTAA